MTHDRERATRVRGFFAVGIYGGKTPQNLGTLWRSATLYGASFVFTVGKRYEGQPSDTCNTPKHTPLFHFTDLDDLRTHQPVWTPLVGVELDPRARPLGRFAHPERAIYLLGAEDHGLPQEVIDACDYLLQIETVLPYSMNVAVAGSMVLHDRHVKTASKLEVAS